MVVLVGVRKCSFIHRTLCWSPSIYPRKQAGRSGIDAKTTWQRGSESVLILYWGEWRWGEPGEDATGSWVGATGRGMDWLLHSVLTSTFMVKTVHKTVTCLSITCTSVKILQSVIYMAIDMAISSKCVSKMFFKWLIKCDFLTNSC